MTKALYLSPLTILAIYSFSFSEHQEPKLWQPMAVKTIVNPVVEEEAPAESGYVWNDDAELKPLKKPVRKFLEANPNIDQFEESCANIDACPDYYYLTKDYDLNYPPEQVFKAFVNTKPKELWTGSARFQLSYDPQANDVYTLVEEAPLVAEDMIIALNLKIFGLTSIPVVFKIVTLDKEAGIIEFSYVEENMSHGIQSVHVKDDGAGGTIITHQTRYYSGKKFRDKTLYPFIHHRLTGGFYKNLKRLLADQASN